MDLIVVQCEDVDWIGPAEEMIQWRAPVYGWHKGRKSLDQLSDYHFLKNISAPFIVS
jgi:hypothetical protein